MTTCEFTPKIFDEIKAEFGAKIIDAEVEQWNDSQIKSALVDIVRLYKNYVPAKQVAMSIWDIAQEYFLAGDPNLFYGTVEEIENDLRAGDSKVADTIENNTDEILTDSEAIKRKVDARTDFLHTAYGHATAERLKVERQVSISLVNSIIIDRENDSPIITGEDINRNIRNYQQKLFNTVIDYVKEAYRIAGKDTSVFEDTEMYKTEGDKTNYTGRVHDLFGLIQSVLKPEKFNADLIIALSQEPEGSSEYKRLQAFNAWNILKHFDSMVLSKFGKSIEITNFGDMEFENKNYAIAQKGANNKTTWRTSEEIILEEEIDNIVQQLVVTTPKYTYGASSPNVEDYLTFADFSNAISKIKDLIYSFGDFIFDNSFFSATDVTGNKISKTLSEETKNTIKGQRFTTIINSIRRNPLKYLPAIFEVLANPIVFDYINGSSRLFKTADGTINFFNKQDKDNIYSIYKGLFANEQHSLYFVNKKNLTNNYYSYLTLTVDSIFGIKFLQYYQAEDGTVTVRNMRDGVLDNQKRIIELTINAINSRILNKYNLNKSEYNIHEKDNRVIFKAGDYEVSVSLDGNTLKFTKDGEAVIPKASQNNILFINKILGQNFTLESVKKIPDMADPVKDLMSFACRVLTNTYISNEKLTDKGKPIESRIKLHERLKQIFGDNIPKINSSLREINLVHNNDVATLRRLANYRAVQQKLLAGSQIKGGDGNSLSNSSLSRLLGGMNQQFELQNRKANSATVNSLFIAHPEICKGVYTAQEFKALAGNKAHTSFNVGEFSYSLLVYDFIGGMYNPYDNEQTVGGGIIALLPSVNSDKSTIGRLLIDTNYKIGGKSIRELNSQEFRQLIAEELGGIYARTYDAIEEDFLRLWKYLGFTDLWDQQAIDFYAFNKKCYESGITDVEKYLKEKVKEFNSKNRQNPIHIIDQVHYMVEKDTYRRPDGIEISVKGLKSNDTFMSYLYRYAPEFLAEKQGFTDKFESIKDDPEKFRQFNLANNRFVTEDEFWLTKSTEIIKSLIDGRFSLDLLGDSSEIKNLKQFWAPQHLDWIDQRTGQLILGKWNGQKLNNSEDIIVLDKWIKETANSELNAKLSEAITNEFLRLQIDPTKLKTSNWQALIAYLEKVPGSDLSRIKHLQNLKDRIFKNKIIDDIQLLVLLLKEGIGTFELNPLIEQYNYMDYLFTLEFMISTVGSCIAHPSKMKGKFTVLEEEAGRFNAQHKRNVSYTAAMQEFQLGLLEGIPEYYNIAVIDDIKDTQYNVSGDEDGGIKPYDGATYVNPFIVYLENYSLGGAKAGITKKQFVHYYDERTGTGGIIKTCGFGITNDWMRNSPLIEKMMYKMTHHTWLSENSNTEFSANILNGYNGLIKYESVVVKKGNNFYQIDLSNPNTIQKQLGVNEYKIFGRQLNVLQHGMTADMLGYQTDLIDITLSFTEILNPETGNVKVNSNYSLWQLFGGKNCYELNNNSIRPSEASIRNVVAAMNGIGVRKSNNVLTQDDVYQPLKHSDIHYAATAGAVKQGAANINGKNVYHDDSEYDFFRIKMYQAGIQLDKEHHADGAELSLMTLVISACSHRGYTSGDAMNIYQALRVLTNTGTNNLLKPFQKYFNLQTEEARQEFIQAVVDQVVNSLARQDLNDGNLITNLASDLMEKARNGEHLKFEEFDGRLPIDNSAIQALFIKEITVFLTKSGIKMKIPGILSVLTPSYEIMKLYDGKKWEAIQNNELGQSTEEYLNTLQESYDNNPIYEQPVGLGNDAFSLYLQQTEVISTQRLRIGRTYKVLENGSEKYIPVNTPREYRLFKLDISNGKYSFVSEYVKNGRNLGNFNVLFSGYVDGEYKSFLLYDLDSIMALFDLKEILDSGDQVRLTQFAIDTQAMHGLDLTTIAPDDLGKLLEKSLRQQVFLDIAALSSKTGNIVSKKNGLRVGINNSVKIDKKDVVIDKNSISTEAYELVLPKIFIKEFGLDEFDDLYTIEHDLDFFVKRMLSNFSTKSGLSENNFDVELKNVSGNHYYIMSPANFTKSEGLKEIEFRKFDEGDRLLRLGNGDKTIYELSSQNDKVYVDLNGTEIIVTDNPEFYFDNLDFSAIRFSTKFKNHEMATYLQDHMKDSENKVINNFINYLSTDVKSIGKKNRSFVGDLTNSEDGHWLLESLRKRGREMWSSFMKQLEVVASRTPSQSMQSFMPMRIVAFDNPNINTAYVSTALIWLLGSDYR